MPQPPQMLAKDRGQLIKPRWTMVQFDPYTMLHKLKFKNYEIYSLNRDYFSILNLTRVAINLSCFIA